jgi:hypothetical protein
MKVGLFQQVVELNQSFDRLMAGLEKLESVPFFQRDLIQHARSDVEIARVYANREFFGNFEAIVENDAKWAYRFQRRFDEKLKDPDDVYLEVRDSEDRRKQKGLPPRIVVLPNWEMSDEERYDEKQRAKRKKGAAKRRGVRRKPSKKGAGRFEIQAVSRLRGGEDTVHENARKPVSLRDSSRVAGIAACGGRSWTGLNTNLKRAS